MKLRYRAMFLAVGVFVSAYGWTRYVKYGVFPYLNRRMQPLYPIGVIAIGVVFAALAFLPNHLRIERDRKSRGVLRIKKF